MPVTLACIWTRKPICSKVGKMLDIVKLFSNIPVWMTLTVTEDHRVTGKLELVPSVCCKMAWSNRNISSVWLHQADDFRKDMYLSQIWIVWVFGPPVLFCFSLFGMSLCVPGIAGLHDSKWVHPDIQHIVHIVSTPWPGTKQGGHPFWTGLYTASYPKHWGEGLVMGAELVLEIAVYAEQYWVCAKVLLNNLWNLDVSS